MAYTSWYESCKTGLAPLQRSLAEAEERTALQRAWSPDLVSGLLQTPAYAKAVLSACIAVLGVPSDLDEVVAQRMRRQHGLDDPKRQFQLLIGEAALLRIVGSHDVMVEQLQSLLRTLEARPQVQIGIVPTAVEFIAPTPDFVLRDADAVESEALSGEVISTRAEDIALAERTFELLYTQALYGRDACELIAQALKTHASH